MRSLFWKIFLSFWAALIVFTVSVLWISSHFLEEMRAREHSSHPMAMIMRYQRDAQGIADREGVEGLSAWVKRIDKQEVVPVLLIREDGEEILGRAVPHRIARMIQRGSGFFERHRAPRHITITLQNGTRYFMVPDFSAVNLTRVLHRPHVLIMPFLIAALVSAIVCILLARYLTAPITRLERATKQLAEGDLSHRVSADMGRRKDEIADLAAAFDHMAERLEAAMASQKRLLSDVSHELRSPLARLQVALGLARQRDREQTIATELDRIERESERLNEMIAQLLSLSRLESEKHRQHFEDLDLNEILQAVVDNARYEAQAWQVNINYQERPEAVFQGDYATLTSAFENIVRNAIKYSPEQGEVEVRLIYDNEAYRIEVSDQGPGVPETELRQLFKAFVRVGEARDRASGGVGLGLAIAERAIHLHQGTISARNNEPTGLCVAVHLPK